MFSSSSLSSSKAPKSGGKHFLLKTVFSAYVFSESLSFARHQKRVHDMENAPRRVLDPSIDLKKHLKWFAKELKAQPNPRQLFRDLFNDAEIETIPRNRAVYALCFFMTAKESSEYETNTYPRQVIEAADKILMNMEEKEKGKLRFAKNVPAWPAMPEDDRKSSGSGGMANALRERAFGANVAAFQALGYREKGPKKEHKRSSSSTRTTTDENHPEFVRPNTYAITAFYKPLLLQAFIAWNRRRWNQALREGGFVESPPDEKTGVVLWTREASSTSESCSSSENTDDDEGDDDVNEKKKKKKKNEKNPNRHVPVVFLHGLGVGVGPYSSWIIERLPKDRTILCPEWPNISYGIERGHEYPTPRELAQFLRTSVENAIKKVKNKTQLTTSEIKCDCIGHSYGTVVLTGFRRYCRDVVRRSVFIDPVCFVPSFGRYLKYAFEEHLHAWFQFSSYIRTKIKNPDEPMDFMNVFMSTWFVKGDPSTQHLMKRLLFPQESWERGPLDERDCLVLSGKDEIVPSEDIRNTFQKTWPKTAIFYQGQWQHGGFLLEEDPEKVNEALLKFIERGREEKNNDVPLASPE